MKHVFIKICTGRSSENIYAAGGVEASGQRKEEVKTG
jgi:hypothetical protein